MPSSPKTKALPVDVNVFPLMLLALKDPVESRFTIALLVLLLVGGTAQFSPRVPLVVTGEPVTVKSEDGALRATLVTHPHPPSEVLQAQAEPLQSKDCPEAQVVIRLRPSVPLVPPPVSPLPAAVVTPVMVPAPGNVCPLAKVMSPLLFMLRPVSAGVPEPDPNKRFSVAESVDLLLLTASAWNRNVCATAA